MKVHQPPHGQSAAKEISSEIPREDPVLKAGALQNAIATQNTFLKSLAHTSINITAMDGPRNAPTESKACRNPNADPLSSGGVMSTMSASLGASRIPLPIRSRNRAPRITSIEVAVGNMGLVIALKPYPTTARIFRRPKKSLKPPENTFIIKADDSATPSMSPTVKTLAPIVLTRYMGSKL